MVPECTFVYPSGHRCRRIPRRGQPLCPGHRNTRAVTDDPGPDLEMFAFAQSLESLPLPDLLASVSESLSALLPLFDRRFACRLQPHFTRATLALDCALNRAHSAAPPSPNGAARVPSIEDLERACEQILKITESRAASNA
jgi:hypothetical protein